MPSVTPVCFASMYSGVMPEIHGIMRYEKPVLKIKTVFDALAAAGKRCAIVSTEGDSISKSSSSVILTITYIRPSRNAMKRHWS